METMAIIIFVAFVLGIVGLLWGMSYRMEYHSPYEKAFYEKVKKTIQKYS